MSIDAHLICKGCKNKSVLEYNLRSKNHKSFTHNAEIACIIPLNFPIMFVVKKVNNATSGITIYCMGHQSAKFIHNDKIVGKYEA